MLYTINTDVISYSCVQIILYTINTDVSYYSPVYILYYTQLILMSLVIILVWLGHIATILSLHEVTTHSGYFI